MLPPNVMRWILVSMAPQVNEIPQLMFVPPNLENMANHRPYLGDLGAINGWTYNFSHWLGSPTIFWFNNHQKTPENHGVIQPPQKKPLELHCWSRPKAKMRGPGKSSMQNASRAWQERSWELGWYPMVDPQSSPWVSILSHGHDLDDLEVPSYFGKPAYNLYNHCPRGKMGSSCMIEMMHGKWWVETQELWYFKIVNDFKYCFKDDGLTLDNWNDWFVGIYSIEAWLCQAFSCSC